MEKAAEIMDVNAVAVAHTMQRAGVSILVHGHTHRPAIHDESANGAGYARIVLGDWYTQGSVLVWDDKGYRLETRRLNTDT
jgi:UDP-2,3-diacylglucosamine hydrolase